MHSNTAAHRFSGASGQKDHWQGLDRDGLDLDRERSAPDWGLVALLLGYGALIIGGMMLIV